MTEPLTPPQPEGDAPLPVGSDATVQMPVGDPGNAEATTRMTAPPVVLPPSLPVVPAPSIEKPPRPRSRMGWALGAAVVLLGGAAVFFYLRAQPAPAAPVSAQEPVPAGVQVYVDRAQAGDSSAMRMLGVMYYYGLNVRQDRDKGLAWYRRAAAQGDPAAREDLAKLQPAGSGK